MKLNSRKQINNFSSRNSSTMLEPRILLPTLHLQVVKNALNFLIKPPFLISEHIFTKPTFNNIKQAHITNTINFNESIPAILNYKFSLIPIQISYTDHFKPKISQNYSTASQNFTLALLAAFKQTLKYLFGGFLYVFKQKPQAFFHTFN